MTVLAFRDVSKFASVNPAIMVFILCLTKERYIFLTHKVCYFKFDGDREIGEGKYLAIFSSLNLS